MTAGHPIPDVALASHLAILGKTGAGKSYAARSTIERVLHRKERVCIVDPTGVWWGLRLDASGKARGGFPVLIAGGRHGDVPLTEDDGAALARIVGTTSIPMILDTSSLTVSARTRLFTAFAEALVVENRGPLHLVLDEAHLFAPQTRVPDPQSAMMVHAANSLVSLGRARGLRILLLTQRPAKLHKDTLTQVETLVAMRLVAPQDRKAVEGWIVDQAEKKRGAEIVASLPTLRTGEAWVWSPDAGLLDRVAFPRIVTFDSMRPEAQGARELLPVDVGAVRAALAAGDAPEKVAPIPKAGGAEIAAAERRGYERGLEDGLRRGSAYAARIVSEIDGAIEPLLGLLERRMVEASTGRWTLPGADREDKRDAAPEIGRPAPAAAAAGHPRATRPAKKDAAVALNSAALKLLAVLDTNPPVRRSWTQVATLAGLRARGGHFNAGRKGLIDGGLVHVEGDLVRIAAPSEATRPEASDGAALVEMWAGNLSGAAPRILRRIATAGATTRLDVADALGLQPRGGHWNAAWKELRDNDLIEEEGDLVQLAEFFRLQPAGEERAT